MVFDFIKKKLQTAITAPASETAATAQGGYEARRRDAEALHARGETERAVAILEALAADLAGTANFTLAVAVRHQIHQWTPERDATTTAEIDAEWMAAQRAEQAEEPEDPSLRMAVEASPLLSELTAAEIAGLIKSTGLSFYQQGEVVLKEGSAGEDLYIVTRGFLDVTSSGVGGKSVRVGKLTVGDFFGEVALLTGKPRAATVTAETDAECLLVSSENWKELVETHPRILQLVDDAIKVRARLSADAILDDLRKQRR